MAKSESTAFTRVPVSAMIESDRACPRCSYNLRGLKTGERCPECGTPITLSGRSRFSNNITDAPLEYLVRLSQAGWIALASAALGLLTLGWMLWEAHSGSPSVASASAAVVAASAWGFAIHRINGPRPPDAARGIDTRTEWFVLRRANQATQWLWLGAAVMFVLGAAASGGASNFGAFADGTGVLLCVVAYFGFIPVVIHFSLMSDWADDTSLSHRLRIAPYVLLGVLPLGALAYWRATNVFGPITLMGAGVFVGAFLTALVYFLIGPYQFARLLIWAAKNANTALDTDRRRSSNIVKRIEDGLSKAEPAPPPRPAISKAPKQAAPARSPSSARTPPRS